MRLGLHNNDRMNWLFILVLLVVMGLVVWEKRQARREPAPATERR